MYAVLETGGKQMMAKVGQYIDIEKLPQQKGDKIALNNVLMLVSGKDSKIGNPYVKGLTVNGQIVDEGKSDKIIVYKMRRKKGTRKKQGHRQWFTRLFIESIEQDGKVLEKSEVQYKERKKVVQQSKKTKEVKEAETEELQAKPAKKKTKKKGA